MMQILRYHKHVLNSSENWSYFFKIFKINSPYLSKYGHRIHKSWLNRSFGITMKHFTKQIAPYAACMEKKEFKSTKLFTHFKKEWILILSQNPKNVKVSENSVKNILDSHPLLNTNLPNIKRVRYFLYFYATIPGETVVYTMI